MTVYERNNLPDEMGIAPIHEDLTRVALLAIQEALDSDLAICAEAKVAKIYDRGNDMGVFPVSSNHSYSPDRVIEIKVRIPQPKPSTLPLCVALEENIIAGDKKEEQEKLEAEILAAENAYNDAVANLKAKKQELAQVKKG